MPGRRAPRLLVLAAVIVALAAVVPLGYLVLRGLPASSDDLELVPLRTTVELVVDTALLAAGVVAVAVALGISLAWLVVRTDLPGRRPGASLRRSRS